MTQVQNPEEHDYGTQRGRKRVWEPNRDPSKGIRSRVRRSEDRGMVASQDLTRLQASGSAVIVCHRGGSTWDRAESQPNKLSFAAYGVADRTICI